MQNISPLKTSGDQREQFAKEVFQCSDRSPPQHQIAIGIHVTVASYSEIQTPWLGGKPITYV